MNIEHANPVQKLLKPRISVAQRFRVSALAAKVNAGVCAGALGLRMPE